MKKTLVALSATTFLALSTCSNMSTTQQRTLSGSAIGAAAGVGISALTVVLSCGALRVGPLLVRLVVMYMTRMKRSKVNKR